MLLGMERPDRLAVIGAGPLTTSTLADAVPVAGRDLPLLFLDSYTSKASRVLEGGRGTRRALVLCRARSAKSRAGDRRAQRAVPASVETGLRLAALRMRRAVCASSREVSYADRAWNAGKPYGARLPPPASW